MGTEFKLMDRNWRPIGFEGHAYLAMAIHAKKQRRTVGQKDRRKEGKKERGKKGERKKTEKEKNKDTKTQINETKKKTNGPRI